MCLDQRAQIVHFLWKKAWAISGCFQIILFSKLSLIGHNLYCGRPISQTFLVFSSCSIVLQYDVLRSAGPNCPFYEKKRELLVGVFKSVLFSKLSLIGHNLCCGRPISQTFLVLSSYLIVLQYDVLRSAGPNCPFSEKKRVLLVGVLQNQSCFRS